MRLSLGKIALVSVGLLLSLGVRANAQASASSGAIQGAVRDSSGAILPDVTVKLENTNLGITRSTKTKTDGTYIFPVLQPGAGYAVSVETPGFKTERLKNIRVSITETTNANLTLSVGEVTQEVTVSSEAETVQTTSATLGRVVGERVITGLPLPTRNVLDIMATDAGVIATLDSPAATIVQSGTQLFVAGSRATANNYLFNGVDANNFEFQTLAAGVTPIPSPDSLQEFRTQTSLYDATSGYGSGGNINLITRSGTSKYHGVVYDFFRNTALNANDYILKQNGNPKPVLQQNQFGVSFGGPIPKLHDTFFFVNYEGMRQKNGITGSVTVTQPVLPSGTLTAQSLATAFSTNTVTINPNDIDPVTVALLNAPGPYNGKLIPSGTGTVGTLGTFSFTKPDILNSDQVSSRVDRDFKIHGQANHLTGTGFVHNQLFTNPSGASGTTLGQPYSYPLGSQNAVINDTHIFKSNLINEAVYGYNWDRRDILATGGLTLDQIGMTRSNASVTPLLPNFAITNQASVAGYAANVQHPQHAASFDFRDTLTWILNKHSLRFGFEHRREEFNDGVYLPRGALTFAGKIYSAGVSTPFQDFLTGSPSGITYVANLPRLDFRAHDYIGFAQDDWRALPKLTINAGVRYDHLGNPFEIKDQISNFDPSLLNADALQNGGAGLAAAYVAAGKNGVSRTTMLGANNGSFSPRIGFAYDVLGNSKLAVRGGYGIYYQNTGYALQLANSGNPPYQVATSSNPAAGTKDVLANPFPVLPLPNQFPQNPVFPRLVPGTGITGAPVYTANGQPANTMTNPALTTLSAAAIDRYIRSPYTQNWNVTAEWEFLPEWTIEVGYLGSHGVRQTSSTQRNNALFTSAAAPIRPGIVSNSSANRDARVPIAGYNAATGFSFLTNNADSEFNAFIATLNHHFSHGFFIKAAYTHSHSTDDYIADPGTNYAGANIGNQYSLALNRGTSEQDVPNRFVWTYTWDLPWFKHGALSPILGHWQISGISTFQDGAAGYISQSISNGSFAGASGFAAITPGCKLVPSGRTQDHLKNYLNSACATTQPLQVSGSSVNNLNPDQTPGTGSYPVSGNGGYLLGPETRGAYHAPFQERTDLTVAKNFPLHLLGPAGNLEFRAESFKIFNNAIFSPPQNAAGAANFGQILTTVDSTGRQFQFALKASF